MKSKANIVNEKDISQAIKNIDNHFDLDFEARMIMYRFLSEVENICERENISKKELAKRIGTSASYVTQLFRGNKIINLSTIAKIQHALNFKFEIVAISNDSESKYAGSKFEQFRPKPCKIIDLNVMRILKNSSGNSYHSASKPSFNIDCKAV